MAARSSRKYTTFCCWRSQTANNVRGRGSHRVLYNFVKASPRTAARRRSAQRTGSCSKSNLRAPVGHSCWLGRELILGRRRLQRLELKFHLLQQPFNEGLRCKRDHRYVALGLAQLQNQIPAYKGFSELVRACSRVRGDWPLPSGFSARSSRSRLRARSSAAEMSDARPLAPAWRMFVGCPACRQ